MLTVCITGGSGSGKSTLTQLISQKLPQQQVTLLPMDAYYKSQGHLSSDEKQTFNFDHPDAFDFELFIEHLQLLKLYVPIERPSYSFLNCTRQRQTETVHPGNIILIDGIFALLNDDLKKEIDLKFFLDVNEQNRLSRIMQRDVAERGRTPESVTERFYRQVKPMHDEFVDTSKISSDVILDFNDGDVIPASKVILSLIQNCVELQAKKNITETKQ